MTQLFFPNYCCAMDQIAGDTPEAVDAFRRCNRLGPGQQLLPNNFYVIPEAGRKVTPLPLNSIC
ncbi:hypothetical protein [Desulfatitalea alkaliphila]|uniref:Uncharacterized protein n=1 Tax=Desulfatitalea alkaliphila TaxID=2929485 RepID=A0AA41R044_9BACT|nr:hypothetical protein [Desulfatitalea alkaliphila]MCJ8499548.1 hypothetical protein [Desulfatitalea alkaliphila]